jgi:hypothetical protein
MRLSQGAARLDADQHVLEPALRGRNIVGVAGGDHRPADAPGCAQQAMGQHPILGQVAPLQLDPELLAAKDVAEAVEGGVGPLLVAGQDGHG